MVPGLLYTVRGGEREGGGEGVGRGQGEGEVKNVPRVMSVYTARAYFVS